MRGRAGELAAHGARQRTAHRPKPVALAIEQDRDRCAGRIEVGLTRGRLRPPRPMRLDISCWSPSSARTVLELVPAQRVRPTAAYFRSGHLLLDSLTHSLLRHAGAAT